MFLNYILMVLAEILMVYLSAATLFFHHQVLREEEFLKDQYGEEYTEYCNVVRIYL